jgi:hypothetical protein
MYASRFLLNICFIFCALTCFASQDKPNAQTNIEIGADSNERRFFRPYLRFEFPFNKTILFTEANYYQRINSQLKGEVDFWLIAGLLHEFTNTLTIETSLNHFCRHITSRTYPIIFDANEVLGRLWYHTKAMKLGFGGGFYIGGHEWYDNLLVLNYKYPSILQTEFGIDAEFKLINFKKVLHDLEFYISINENLDLFLRNTRHYEYNNTTYLGMRFKSGVQANDIIRKLEFQTGYFPSYDRHKMESILAVALEFFKKHDRRLQLSLISRLPVLRDDTFFHTFRPEIIEYPLSLQYERRINNDLLAFGYCLYDVTMPVDSDQAFRSSLGTGVGIRNQPFFEKLDRTIRFDIFGGPNFTHTYDAGAKFGVNTIQKPLNFGINTQARINADTLEASLTVFGEFGGTVKIRIFASADTTKYYDDNTPSDNRWQLGVSLFSWFN